MTQKTPIHGFRRDTANNSLAALPPRTEVETVRTLKKAIRANTALAELRGAGGLIPNQAILIRAILLQEAKLSSEIENIVTTNDKLYRAMEDSPKTVDPHTKEVIRYEQALRHGYQAIQSGKPLSASLFVEIARVIKQVGVDVRRSPGCQVVNDRTREPVYTPPEGEALIRDLLDNLSEYLHNDDDTDPLIKMAVAHYQFEAIHPFPDGNGRTGRVLNVLYLVDHQLLHLPVLFHSRFIIAHKPEYYRGLRRVTEEGAWEDWIVFMLEALEDTATHTHKTIQDIRSALDSAIGLAQSQMSRGYSKELIELVFSQPYTRISFVEKAGIAKRETGSAYLRELERIGILHSQRYGREVLFVNQTLMDLLTR